MTDQNNSTPVEEELTADLAPEKPLSIFALCETDSDAAENGKWFDNLFQPDSGVSVKLRRFSSKKSINYRSRLLQKYKRHLKNGEYPPEIEERMLIEQMVECIIVDWKGILDNDGKEIAYSKEKALLLCKMLDFRAPLIQLAVDMDNFRAEERKELEKN
jgi:hypothetical protein